VQRRHIRLFVEMYALEDSAVSEYLVATVGAHIPGARFAPH
jgi:hypothetical protein